ncbi:unnamed protein product [Vitrella brassicaformis CCMP3155]|uniref:Nucleotide-diphospho-sugar transferase domain-containing protein n=1 Tax=Vitrella brassicaformis (strain CCMP3155) TaxID=1169540 RepID=A0A0G4ELE3_VITBC|nr:unnamed protein product [Vitrella brassicaformis CCMP3155]|eukprot:CEL97996.1 unnamed protein product [Vitrella brassicaformis CCMP3155]
MAHYNGALEPPVGLPTMQVSAAGAPASSPLPPVRDQSSIQTIPGRGDAARIAIVSLMWYPSSEAKDWEASLSNVKAYANKWGYSLVVDVRPRASILTKTVQQVLDLIGAGSFSSPYERKLQLVSYALQQKGYDYIVWKDADMIVVNCEEPIEALIRKWKCEDRDAIFFTDTTTTAINSGAFFLKNTEFSHRLIADALKIVPRPPQPIGGDQTALVFVLLGSPTKCRSNLDECLGNRCYGQTCFRFFSREAQHNMCLLQYTEFGRHSYNQFEEGNFGIHFAGKEPKGPSVKKYADKSTCADASKEGRHLHLMSTGDRDLQSRWEYLTGTDAQQQRMSFCKSTALSAVHQLPFGVSLTLLPHRRDALTSLEKRMKAMNASRADDEIFVLMGPLVWLQKDPAGIIALYIKHFPSRPTVLPASHCKFCPLSRRLFPLFTTARHTDTIAALSGLNATFLANPGNDSSAFVGKAQQIPGVAFDEDHILSVAMSEGLKDEHDGTITVSVRDRGGGRHAPAVVVLDGASSDKKEDSTASPPRGSVHWTAEKLARYVFVEDSLMRFEGLCGDIAEGPVENADANSMYSTACWAAGPPHWPLALVIVLRLVWWRT